ncbi:MAG: glycoside hydrolase family 99-like domain-containing protein, partial [Anaeroplasmataceae bacterium]|nr:glycoside hydrolase family 99-like domain-containing protein [Anaeroplasmataceae bacterium]
MVQYWNLLAKEEGFSGMYFIGTNDPKWKMRKMDAGLIYEPGHSQHEKSSNVVYAKKMKAVLKKMNINIPCIYHYDMFWKGILKRQDVDGMYYGGVVDYDNTPRKSVRGDLMWGMTPHKFGKYFRCLYQKAVDRGDAYIFLNAWNEWGEGAYLEPDSKYGIRCLQELKNAIKSV